MSASSGLTFRLLDVVVAVAAPDDLVRRLATCYAALPRADEDSVAVLASVSGPNTHGEYEVAVTGREVVTVTGSTEAVRAVNHQLVHAVMLARPELFFVHAGVVAVDGRAIVLPGLSRAGKSTLVLALVLAGAAFLSDELLVFDPARAELLGFPRALKIRDECVGYFPEIAARFEGTGEGRFLPFDAVPALTLAPTAAPTMVVVPRWDPDGDSCPVVTGRGAALLALTESALNFGTHRATSIDHLAALTAGTEGFAIRWSEPHAAARALLAELGRAPSLHS